MADKQSQSGQSQSRQPEAGQSQSGQQKPGVLLDIRNLRIEATVFPPGEPPKNIVLVHDVSLTLQKGKVLGLIGEYVWVTLSESKDRPVYIVRDVVRSDVIEDPHASGIPIDLDLHRVRGERVRR